MTPEPSEFSTRSRGMPKGEFSPKNCRNSGSLNSEAGPRAARITRRENTLTTAGVTLLSKSQTASNATYQIRGALVGTDGTALGNTLLPSNSVAQYARIPIAGGVRVIVTGVQVPITNNWTTKFIYEK